MRPDDALGDRLPKRLGFSRSYLWTTMPLNLFPDPRRSLLLFILFLMHRRRNLLQKATPSPRINVLCQRECFAHVALLC